MNLDKNILGSGWARQVNGLVLSPKGIMITGIIANLILDIVRYFLKRPAYVTMEPPLSLTYSQSGMVQDYDLGITLMWISRWEDCNLPNSVPHREL